MHKKKHYFQASNKNTATILSQRLPVRLSLQAIALVSWACSSRRIILGVQGFLLPVVGSSTGDARSISTTPPLLMRKENPNGTGPGKLVAKQNLPSKVCVVCHRPFTWRKKWERVWDEVTTCSKSCNAKRKLEKKQGQNSSPEHEAAASSCTASASSEEEEDIRHATDTILMTTTDDATTPVLTKKELRQQHKQAVKAQKQQQRAKRMGNAPELGRKPCDLCCHQVDLLIRCTVDETQQYKMVCGKCWPNVSGGIPDGSAEYPHYHYGGLWKNRNASMKKKIGNGTNKKGGQSGTGNADSIASSSLLDEIESSRQRQEEEEDDEQSR